MPREKRTSKAALAIDLFAGVGGLSLGAARAGFTVKCAVEIDKQAGGTHSINFPTAFHLALDVRTLSGERLLREAGVAPDSLSGLIGGPPCQGFSTIGLRAASDERNYLLLEFFRLVSETGPAFFLAENVPGVLDERNAAVLEAARSRVPSRYVQLEPLVVRASDFGAPTSRTRVFFYGYDPERVAALTQADFAPRSVVDVRVRDALLGLPRIRSTWRTEEQSWRAVGTIPNSAYADALRSHVPIGVGAEHAIRRLAKRNEVSGFLGTTHEAETIERFRTLRPGQSDSVSKCTRLDANGYCPTLRAGTGPERGSYQAVRPVHPTSPRVISPREAARLQGFPDWFQFHPTKWHAFRQIGNSVSPIVGEYLLRKIMAAMG